MYSMPVSQLIEFIKELTRNPKKWQVIHIKNYVQFKIGLALSFFRGGEGRAVYLKHLVTRALRISNMTEFFCEE
jgi:hypothetical protein